MNNLIYINKNIRFARIDSRNWQLERKFSEEESLKNRRALEGLKGKNKADTLEINEWSFVGYFSRLSDLLNKAMEVELFEIKEAKEIKEAIENFKKDIKILLEQKDLKKSLIQMGNEEKNEEW